MRTLANSLIRDGRIRTTAAKAKALRPYFERLITHARVDSATARRLVLRSLGTTSSLQKLFASVGPKYISRAGGYTRVIKADVRKSDGAKMAIIELV